MRYTPTLRAWAPVTGGVRSKDTAKKREDACNASEQKGTHQYNNSSSLQNPHRSKSDNKANNEPTLRLAGVQPRAADGRTSQLRSLRTAFWGGPTTLVAPSAIPCG
ncbi:hypothetical protein Vafri_10459 [Volvox africanus]|uniref:Uncharacterized protein n=1 Tax=Volvox africanus TaxID=51714 RepID=A0A8J4F3B8_9CHLO|nr:hypothetical protein Vafri_10459 [Volvox africanus]